MSQRQETRIQGHQKAAAGRNFCRYSVYENKTDRPVIIDGTADECAAALKRSRNSFYCLVNRVAKGRIKKYTILRRFEDEEEESEVA